MKNNLCPECKNWDVGILEKLAHTTTGKRIYCESCHIRLGIKHGRFKQVFIALLVDGLFLVPIVMGLYFSSWAALIFGLIGFIFILGFILNVGTFERVGKKRFEIN